MSKKSGTPIFFFQKFVVEAGIIYIDKVIYIFTILMISTSTSKILEKEKGGTLFLTKLINIINIFIKLNFNGRIVDAVAV